MQIAKFVIALILTVLLIFTLDLNHPYGSQLPPVGRFFNPFSGIWQNAPAAADQQRSSEISLPGLEEEVRIIFDERMVPHIFAQNETDLFYAQGYVMARFRLWQMDISVRAAGGMLSEILGEVTLEKDRQQRRKGMLWAAERTWEAWQRSPEEKRWVEAYTQGINDYVAQLSPSEYPFEFKLMNYEPEPWTPVKSALFFKNMAEMLCGRNDDLGSTNALSLLGAEMFDFLFPETNPKQSPIIPEGTPWDFEPLKIEPDTTLGREMLSGRSYPYHGLPQPPPFLGSNNWAVAGSKTAAGYPILCNDPHLNLTLPSIWFEVQLHTPEFNAYGVALPGVPGIAIGFNEYYAWGETNVGHDVLDWYRISWADQDKSTYLLDGKAVPVEERTELIEVQGRSQPLIEQVKYTNWGPVVYENEDSPYQDMAMRWTAHDASEDVQHELSTFVKLMKGKNYEDYSQALSSFDTPPQNFIFASKSGDIALRVNGKFPLKRKEQGRFIQDGTATVKGWQGFIPKAQVPQMRNPERGFVSSANQRSTDATYPYYYLGGFDDYRGRMVNRLLGEMDNITVEDMMKMQNNNYSIKAEEGVPALLGQLDQTGLDEVERQMITDLSSWDFRFEEESKAAYVFTSWLSAAYELTFDEILTAAAEQEMAYPETWRFLELIYQEPYHAIFDRQESPEKETARDIITRALKETAGKLKEQYGDEDYSWGEFKGTHIPHLGRVPGLGSGYLSVGGYTDAINSIKGSHGPSWRMVVQLGPQIEAWGVYPGGQSGDPGSPHYDDMIEKWRKGEYYKLHFLRGPQDAALETSVEWQLKAK
jgi:penicillin amidase